MWSSWIKWACRIEQMPLDVLRLTGLQKPPFKLMHTLTYNEVCRIWSTTLFQLCIIPVWIKWWQQTVLGESSMDNLPVEMLNSQSDDLYRIWTWNFSPEWNNICTVCMHHPNATSHLPHWPYHYLKWSLLLLWCTSKLYHHAVQYSTITYHSTTKHP